MYSDLVPSKKRDRQKKAAARAAVAGHSGRTTARPLRALPRGTRKVSGASAGVAQPESARRAPEVGLTAQALAASRAKALIALERRARDRAAAEAAVDEQVRVARGRGATWAQVGKALGVTTEGARKRYGR